MPKVTFSFNIPEENEEYEIARDYMKYYLIIEELDEYLRRRLKYEELTDVQHECFFNVRSKLNELRYEE